MLSAVDFVAKFVASIVRTRARLSFPLVFIGVHLWLIYITPVHLRNLRTVPPSSSSFVAWPLRVYALDRPRTARGVHGGQHR